MNCVVTVAVLLAVTVSFVLSDSAHHRTERRYQCAGYCKGRSKFRYVPGTTYVYNYTANTLTSVRGATKEKSQLHLSATASFHVVSECDFVLQLENVQLTDSDLTNDDIHSNVARSAQFSAALQKNFLHFSFQDGTVDELCPSDDPAWVLNIKRGILSSFQNTMRDLSSSREKRHETDISGTCETRYDVMLEEDEANKPLLVIAKMKNLLACSHRMEHFLSLQSTPYTSSSGAQSLPLIKSKQRGIQVIGDGILQKATNNEMYTFRPFSKHDSGAVTMVLQMLVYRTSHNGGTPQAVEEGPKRRTTLLYEHADAKSIKMDREDTVMVLLNELVMKTHHGVERDVPSVFSNLVSVLTAMDYSELEKVFSDSTDKQTRKFLLDAMPVVRTADGIKVMIRLSKSHEITSAQMDSWLTSLAFQKKPTLDMMSAVLPLLDASPSASALLGTSALVHSYCQQNRNCQEMDQIQDIMKKFEGLLGSGCQSSDQDKQQLIILALKAIGNAGIFIESVDTLRKCIQALNPIEIRLAAISAYRRLPCTENIQSHLLDLYAKKHEDTELRIAAYLAIMQCPSFHTIRYIKDTLYSEDVNQVASFVWTHLTNLQETSSVWKQSVRALVSNDFLQNKFKTDARKFSRNYEGSFFSESLNMGAAAESNVIFTPQSYLPRSATLNLTLDLFGESVNILEFGARAEGFENIVENMFGPEGYFPDSAMNKVLKNLKDKRESDSVENSISHLADQFNSKQKLEIEPSASVYTRVFGNEVYYTQLHGLKEMMHTIRDASPFSVVKKIMQKRDIDFTKSFVLIDGSYTIPTCIGFPLNLALNGSATVGLKLHGYANVKDLFTLNSADIEGTVIPSAAIEFAGTMAVDATVTKAGIRLVNTLHTNTYISGKVKIQGGDLVNLQLHVPHEKIELLDVASQMFVLHRDHFVESKGIGDNVENYTVCSADFASSLIGMKPCMELDYVNSSLHPSAPYFPLTGPFRFHLDISKIDTFNVYEFIFRHQKKISASDSGTSMIFHFDTPGSKVDRKLSAQYVLDWTNGAAKASIMTPFIKITASGKVENSDTATSLDAIMALNNQELITARIGYKRTKTGHTGHYEPFFALSYRKQLIADITGRVNYIEGFKYSANFAIKGLSKEPVTVSGNIRLNGDNFDIMGDIISKPLTSMFHGHLHFSKNYLSAKATVKYKSGKTKHHLLDFSAKLQDYSRGTLIREGVYVTLQMTQFPQYNVDAFWEVQHSNNYFESFFKLAVGHITWQTQQLYQYHSTDYNTNLAVLCTLTCQKLDVDYGVDVLYQVSNATISSHLKTTVTPQHKLRISFNYSHELEDEIPQHKLDIELSSHHYQAGIHGTLTESTPSQHEIQLSSWWGTQTDVHRVNVSGFYLDRSDKLNVEHQLDVTLVGELRGRLVAGLTSSSDLRNYWIKLEVYNKTYLTNVTYIKDIFHFLEGSVQLDESTYSGSLFLLSASLEKGFAVDLKLRKRLTLAAKVTCGDEKHGLQFELYWDKDGNPNKKISLKAEAVGNKKEVLMEIPGHYLKGEVVTVASGLTGFVEWEEHHKISVQLEWNLDEVYADITAKLHTPFPWMKSLSLVGSYSLLENDGILVVQTSWQEEELNLTVSVRKVSTVSNLWGWTLDAHLQSTVPALAEISFVLDFKSCTENQMTVKASALLNYNTKKSTFEANWKSDKLSLLGDIQLNTPIRYLESMKYTLKFTDSSAETAGSLEMNWSLENKIVAEFVIKKVDGTAGAFRIATPFAGYEIASAKYNCTEFHDRNGTTYVRMEASAIFREYLAMFDISGSKSNSSVGGMLQLKTPFTDKFKISVLHQLETGKINESLLVSLAEEQLLFLYLVGEFNSFSNMQLSSGVQMPNQNMNVTVGNRLLPGILQFNCEGKWNNNSINVIAVGRYKNAINTMSVHFDVNTNGSLLQTMKLAFDHTSSHGTFQTSLYLPGDIILANIFIINDSLNWKNRLNFQTPRNTGSIENKQSFLDGIRLGHEVVANLSGQQASGLFTLVKDPQSFIIREAKAVLIVPWTDPVTVLYKLPIDNSHIRPSLVVLFKGTKEIRFQTDLQYQFGQSRLNVGITSPFYDPVVVNASYSLEEGKWLGKILTQQGNKEISIECNLKFHNDMMKISGEIFITHSDLGGDIAGGSFGYNMIDPEITAHALGTYRDKRMGFGLSLMLGKNVCKGSLAVQTPFQNWENLSLSGQVDMAKPTKLAVMTLSQNLEDTTVSGLFSSDIHSSNFSIALTSHISGFYSISVYGSYDVTSSNDHVIELAYDNNGRKVEILGKLQFDNGSFINPFLAEIRLKTPFKGYETLLAHYSFSTRGSEMSIDLQLIKSSWKFIIGSECSFRPGEGNGKVRAELPFDRLKELSISLSYGYRPTTLERTVSIVISLNKLVVETTGTLLVTEDGVLTAGVMIKSPVTDYRQLKCNVVISANKEQQKSVTLTFSKDKDDYVVTGTFTLNTEARLVIVTPLKGYENIESRIGYINHGEEGVNSEIKKKMYGYLAMPSGKSELNIDLNLQEMKSMISAKIVSPLLMIPNVEIKGEYDLSKFPASLNFQAHISADKFMSVQIILDRSSLFGEIITPIDGYRDISLFGSFKVEEEKKQTIFKAKVGKHSFQLLSAITLGVTASEIQAELLTCVSGMERITLHGQYDLLKNEKTALLTLTLDPSNRYELYMSGKADSNTGQVEFRIYTPIPEFKSLLLDAKYDIIRYYNVNLLVEKNGMKNNFGGHVTFTEDRTVIRIETPFKHAEDILLYGTYQTGDSGRSANLTVVRNGHLTILDSSFKFQNGVAVIHVTTPYEVVHELIFTLDLSAVSVGGKESSLSVSVLRNSQHLLKASSHIFIDWSNEINAKFELSSPLLPNNSDHLSSNLYFTPVFPPTKIQVVVMKNAVTAFDFRSDFNAKFLGFTYDLLLATDQRKQLLSIYFSPGENFFRFDINFEIADTLGHYIGDLRINTSNGTLRAIFMSPIIGYEKFSFQWTQGYDFIDSELITPFKGNENYTLAAQFDVRDANKSVKLSFSRNNDMIEFRTNVEHTDSSDTLKLHVVTPFVVFKKCDLHTQYMKFETKNMVDLNVTADNHQFEMCGELFSKGNAFEAKLDASSSVQSLEKIRANFFCNITESVTLGIKLEMGDMSANISGTSDSDFLWGELLASVKRFGQATEHRIMWRLQNTLLTKTAKIAVSVGYELNFVIDAILNISSLKNVQAQLSYIKPMDKYQLYPHTSTYKLQWNVRNIMSFNGGVFLMLHNVSICNLNFNVDFGSATEINVLSADYFGFFDNYGIHLTYHLMNNSGIELTSEIKLAGTEILISLNFMPYKSKFTTQVGEVHFSLSYDVATECKVLEIDYQVSHSIYNLRSNLTLHKFNHPLMSFTLITPIRHYSFLHASNQYSMNTTHTGFKILLQKEDRSGEISFSVWKIRNIVGVEGNMSLPVDYVKSWYVITNLNMTSGFAGSVCCLWNSTEYLAVNFKYAPDSLKADITTPFTGLETINFEFLLIREYIVTVLFYVNWGEKRFIINGTADFTNGSQPEFVIFCHSPWTDPFTLLGKYDNRKAPAVSVILQLGTEVTKLEGWIKYCMKDLMFDMDFVSEFNGNKITAKAGYDFEYPNKWTYLEVRFLSLNLLVNGSLTSGGMEGRLLVRTPFCSIQEIAVDGILTFDQSATFKLRWNDEVYTLHGEYEHEPGQVNCRFTILSPYMEVEDFRLDVRYDHESAYLKFQSLSEILYLDCSYHFQTYTYYFGATLKVPSVMLLKHLSFTVSVDAANLTASAVGQWSASQAVNITASLLPSDHFIKVETPFEGFEKTVASGSLKNEGTNLAFEGMLKVGNDNFVYVHHIAGEGSMQQFLVIDIPTYYKMNFSFTVQFDDVSNMYTKLTFIGTSKENAFSAEGMLNLNDMYLKLSVHHPHLEGILTCKTWLKVNASLQIRTISSAYKMEGSYALSRNDIVINWSTQTPGLLSSTILGGSYKYDRSELKTKLYFNEDVLTACYKINDTSLAAHLKLNSSTLLKIKDFTLDVEGSYSPNLYVSVSCKNNASSAGVGVFINKTEETVIAQVTAHVKPLLGNVNHRVHITYNVKDSQNSLVCQYEGKTIHNISLSYENNDSKFKATANISSNILGTPTALILLKKNWEIAQLEIMNVLIVNLKAKKNEGYLVFSTFDMEHEAFYHLTFEKDFLGTLAFVSPLISSGKVNVTAVVRSDIKNMSVDLKWATGIDIYHATLEVNNTDDRTAVKAEIIALLETILSFNAYIFMNRYSIQAETSLNFLETVNTIMLRHKRVLPLDTELKITTPFLPKEIIRVIMNTDNSSLVLYGSHGNESYGEHITLKGIINHNENMAFFHLKAPKLPLIQYIDIRSTISQGDEGRYALALSTKFLSEMLKIEFSTKFCFSSTGIDTTIMFLPTWEDGLMYGATVVIPFMFSNNMRPQIYINLGKNNTYSLHGTFVNLKDVQQVGFGAQYKLRKLGGALKIDNDPMPGMQVEVDIPLGDNIGHYVMGIKGHKGKNVLGTENALNYTHIGVEWDGKQIEVKYALSYTDSDANNLFNIDKNLQCTFLLELSTPFYGYEQSGLKMYVSLSSSQNLIITTVNYPGNSKPFGFELNYQLKGYNDITLVTQLHIPFISALEDVALVLSNKFEEKHGKFRSVLGGHWNKEELAVTLDGNSKEEIVFKGTVTLKMIGQSYVLEASYESSKREMLGLYVIRAQFTSSLEVLKNVEAYMEINVLKSVLASISQNSKELLGFHIYSDQATFFGLKVRNSWRSAYFVCSYDIEKDIMISAELSWDSNPLNISQFCIIFAMSSGPDDRHEMSATLKLPSRVLMFNLTSQVSSVHIEHACSFSWTKDQIIGFRTIFNIINSSDYVAVSAVGHIDLPHRSFELGRYASAKFMNDTLKYTDIGAELLWDALGDRNKKIGIAFRHYSTGLEIVLQHVAMKNDLVIHIKKNGGLSHDHLPFTVKIEVEYSPLREELITMEAHVQYPTNTSAGINVELSLCHIPTSIDFKIGVEVAQTTKESRGRISAEYLNSYTGQKHRIDLMGKMNLLQPEVKLAVRTAENYFEVNGLLKMGNSGHYGALIELLMNQKEHMSVEASVHLAEPRAELEARYGDSRSYKVYAQVPHYREVALGVKHILYGNEYEDIVIMLRLNTSQQLWSRMKWQPGALTELKTGFLQEWSDITHVVQSIGSGYSEALLKDFVYKCNTVYPMLVDMVDHIVSASMTEVSEMYKDILDMGEEMKNMYKRNDFYLQDILPHFSKFVSYVTGKASGICLLLLDGMECLYLTVKNFVTMIVNTFQIDFSHIFNILCDIKVVASKTGMYIVNFTHEVKRLHSAFKEYLKKKFEDARLGILHAEENMKHLLTYMENYLTDLLTNYIQLLEPYVTSIENTMELLSHRVIDFEDKISEYIFDMVDTVLGAQEVKELAAMYSKYSSWLEELHLQDCIDQATKFFESISKLIMQDIHRVFSDYLEYLHYIIDAMDNIYRNIHAMPVVTYSKHAMNIIEGKAKWLWQHYKLSHHIKVQVHSWIETLHKILLRLLNAVDMDIRSPMKSLTPSITLHPDIGLIEYSQKLPIEWNGFNELPKFEQLLLYEQAKDRANEIASLGRYKYYLMDTFYDITNISLATMLPPFSQYGMVIGKYHYITFDKKFYSFTAAEECSYLLANDFLTRKFSVFVSYKTKNREILKKTLTILIEGHHIEISSDKKVTVDGWRVDLPVAVGVQTRIKHTGERVVVHSKLGIQVECNLHYDICAVEISGWYFGKTAGMLGTFDYEPSNDLSLPNGTIAHTIEAFADSWRVGSAQFKSTTHPAVHTYPPTFEELQALNSNPCRVYFEDQVSPLRRCFSHVETGPFYEMCLSELASSTGVCTSVAAYISQCRRTDVDIWMPQTCVHCPTLNGNTLKGGQLEVYDGVEAMLADVVFVVEQSPCMKKVNLVKLVSKLDASLKLQGLNTHFSVVSFNGREFSEPHTHTSSGKTWATAKGTEKALRSLQSAISNRSSSGNQHTFSALWYASHLPFRATASKTVVLLQCTLCQEREDEYGNMISMLLENDITLHVLQPLAFQMHSGQSKAKKVYGMDLHGAFSGHNLKSLMPSLPLLRQVMLPKDLCTSLALEVNGTLFNLHHLLHNDHGTYRLVKKFIDVWARRVTLTAKPSLCQKCRCMANQDEVGQVMCSKCLAPSTEHFLKEWEI